MYALNLRTVSQGSRTPYLSGDGLVQLVRGHALCEQLAECLVTGLGALTPLHPVPAQPEVRVSGFRGALHTFQGVSS